MMLNKSVNLFNEFHGVKAEVMAVDNDHFTLVLNGTMKGFDSIGEVMHFLLCGTTHLSFVKQNGEYYTAYNLAMMYLNRRCGCNGLVFSVGGNGKTTLWGLDGVSWYKVAEYSCLGSLYHAILSDSGVASIRSAVRGQTSFLSKLKRLLS